MQISAVDCTDWPESLAGAVRCVGGSCPATSTWLQRTHSSLGDPETGALSWPQSEQLQEPVQCVWIVVYAICTVAVYPVTSLSCIVT